MDTVRIHQCFKVVPFTSEEGRTQSQVQFIAGDPALDFINQDMKQEFIDD